MKETQRTEDFYLVGQCPNCKAEQEFYRTAYRELLDDIIVVEEVSYTCVNCRIRFATFEEDLEETDSIEKQIKKMLKIRKLPITNNNNSSEH